MSERRTSPRIAALRRSNLTADEAKLLDDIEIYGCHILHIKEDAYLPGWSYTVGLYDLFRQPEIIVVGLDADMAHYLLNEMQRLIRDGLSIDEGLRQRELLENVECEFRQVALRPELAAVVGHATWFYGGDPFPVSQCVYPDLENRFPWEKDFDMSWRHRQAQLFIAADVSRLERDFWASHDRASSLYDWKFSDPPHTGAYTTRAIEVGVEPVTYVSHDEDDGSWQFHGPSESSAGSACLVCLHHFVDKDRSIVELFDLPRGWCAWRKTPSDPWIRELNPQGEA